MQHTHFFNDVAFSEGDEFGVVKGAGDLSARDGGEPFDPVKVGVFDGHDAAFGKDGFGVVVDELSVDENVASVCENLVAFGFHFFLFGLFDFRHLGHAVDLDAAAVDFDFVRVHGGVGNEDFGFFHAFGLSHADRLVEEKAVGQERVAEGPAGLFEDLYVVEVVGSLEAQDGVDGEACKVLLVVCQEFGGERGLGNPHQVVAEALRVVRVVRGGGLERPAGVRTGQPPSRGNRLRMNPLRHQLLRLTTANTQHNTTQQDKRNNARGDEA